MRQEIIARLTPIFRRVFRDDTLVLFDQMKADDVERWDSLSHVTLISEIEDEFKLKFKLKELVSMKNVGDLIVLLQKKMAG